MKLECYAVMPQPPALVPANPLRAWMDDSPDRFAYRCLPLNIANTWGWEVLSPARFAIHWNGGPGQSDVTFSSLDDYPFLDQLVVSHFTQGIVTFHLGYLFHTPERWNMLATGPLNRPKDGIYALSGIVETDWLPMPFTMNWVLTRPGTVTFEKDDPIALLVPIVQCQLNDIQPEIYDLSDNPELLRQYEVWRESRAEFLSKLQAGDAETLKESWQRFYFLGKNPAAAQPEITSHTAKVRLNPPVDKRKIGSN